MPSVVASVRASTASVWRNLRSMRTALILLLVLALAAVAGSLVPQVGVADARIAAMFRAHPLRAELYEDLGLFDVYGSWWFTFVYSLLLVSLVACLIPRTRSLVRTLRARPSPARDLDAMRHYEERAVAAEPDAAVAAAGRILRRRLFRVRRSAGSAPSLSAEKGLAREIGSLLFHGSFLLLLLGVLWGRGTGFAGKAVIVEGTTWTEAHASYDGQIREGRLFAEDHSGVRVHVEDFAATYRIPSGQPKDFVTRARLADPSGRVVETVDIRVNHPAEIDAVKFYQFGYGWAPVIDVSKDGEPLASGPVVCTQSAPPEGVSALQVPWDCVVRLPTLRPQVGIAFTLWPDSRGLFALLETGTPMPMLVEHQPVMTYTAYRGDLLLGRARPGVGLDTTALKKWKEGVVGADETKGIGGGITVSFPELRRYTVLEVKRDRGLWIVLLAAILLLCGLIPSLYSFRRRVWVRAEPDGGGSVLKIGGFALQRRAQFEDEFGRLVEEMARASGDRTREGKVTS